MQEEKTSKLEKEVLAHLGLTRLAIGQQGQIANVEVFQVASFWAVEIMPRWSASHLMIGAKDKEGVTYCSWGISPLQHLITL
jgi:hypothetical protein